MPLFTRLEAARVVFLACAENELSLRMVLAAQSGSEAYGRLHLTDKSPVTPVRWTRSLLLGILDVRNVGNTAFWTFVPLMYCTTHLDGASGILHF
eukprot:1176599-Prorocentrum_minimum.AAC.1